MQIQKRHAKTEHHKIGPSYFDRALIVHLSAFTNSPSYVRKLFGAIWSIMMAYQNIIGFLQVNLKLNYRKKVFHFALNFLPWEILLIKKLDFEKTDIIKVILVFLISNFFINKNSQGRKMSAV